MDPQKSPVEHVVTKAVKVFVSYSRESSEHERRVLQLCDRLCREGVDCVLDQYIQAPPQGWTKWMIENTEACDFVIVVCTETYERRSKGLGRPDEGRGVKFETLLTYQDLLDGGSVSSKLVPVVFQQSDIGFIPRPLKAFQNYRLDSDDGYEDLYRRLTGQPRILQPPSGGITLLRVGENLEQSLPVSNSTSGEHRLQRTKEVRQGLRSEDRQTVELRIAREFEDYSATEQEVLLRAIRELLHLGDDLRIKGVRRGSVILTLELPAEKVHALIVAIESGELSDYGVISSSLVQRQTNVAVKAYAPSVGAAITGSYDTTHDRSYAVGSGAGAAAGAATGATVGAAAGGPVGALVGAAVGAVAGGLVGHGIAEGINPKEEDNYWSENYRSRPYVSASRTYDDYRPAYQYGWESRAQHGNRRWDEVEPDLERGWNNYHHGGSQQTWDEAKYAIRDAWYRVEHRVGEQSQKEAANPAAPADRKTSFSGR